MKASISERREVAERLYASIGEGLLGLYSAVLGDDAKNRTAVLYKRLAYLIDPGEDVSMSAYDLLSEEDRETLLWVKESGGIDAVQKEVSNYTALCRSIQDADNRRAELCSVLGIDPDTGWSDAMAEMLRRLMPEGMEWLRYDTGEPVPLGGEVKVTVHDEDGDFDRTFAIRSIKYKEDGVLLESTENEMVIPSIGERVKRPAVPAADGEPLEVGQTVRDVDSGIEYKVVGIHIDEDSPVRVMRTDGSHLAKASKPNTLTHQRHVLDADGVPIRVGDEMYGTVEGGPFTVTEVSDKGSVFVDAFPDTGMHGSMLTHTKPEPPDSWETIEEESQLYRCEYFDHMGGSCHDCPGGPSGSCQANMMIDIVKRCKNLAERGES